MTKADKRENIIMIASEPLTFERSEWMEVKTNTMIVITPKVGPSADGTDRRPHIVDVHASYQMNVLQIPIIDEYWVAPQDPASHHRSTDYAIEMGFGGLSWKFFFGCSANAPAQGTALLPLVSRSQLDPSPTSVHILIIRWENTTLHVYTTTIQLIQSYQSPRCDLHHWPDKDQDIRNQSRYIIAPDGYAFGL